MDEPLVSVVIPSYNHAQYIENAIESVLSQTYKNLEIIINDDGSTDQTHQILQKYIGHNLITVILNKNNRNQAAVLNEAIDIAKGEFIGLLPSDDWYLPKKIELQIEKFKQVSNQVGVIYGAGLRYYEESKETVPTGLRLFRGNILEKMITEPFCVFPVTPLFRKSCFAKVRFDESYRAEGERLYLRLAQYCDYDFVDEPVAVMRTHTYNTGQNVNLMCTENLRGWSEFFDGKDFPPKLMKHRPYMMSHLKRLYGLEKIVKNKDFLAGRALLIGAIFERPIKILDLKIICALILTILPQEISKLLINQYKS